MGYRNQETGWGVKEKLLQEILKKLDKLIKVVSKINIPE